MPIEKHAKIGSSAPKEKRRKKKKEKKACAMVIGKSDP